MMPRIRPTTDGYEFLCPACNDFHGVRTDPKHGAVWKFNGDLNKPTFSPSILVRSGHFAKQTGGCWCTYNTAHPDEPSSFKCYRCHSIIEDGKIRYFSDCSHSFAGQTLDLSEL